MLQQGELDAVGLELDSGIVRNIYGIDIAFHESGLNYGSKEETFSRVIKKMARTAMILHGFFNMNKGNIIFASPKINDSVSEPLRQYIDELDGLFKGWGLDFRFVLYANEDFRDKIFNVVTALSSSVSDISELFMRSIQMYNLFKVDFASTADKKRHLFKEPYSSFKGSEEMKIGVFVQTSLSRLIEENLIEQEEVQRLERSDYSKRTFNINYPFFKEYDINIPLNEQRNINGYPRYYSSPYSIFGREYLLCNHWVEDHSRSYFNAWLGKIESIQGGR